MSAFVIDTFEFCRLREQAEGLLQVADLVRLADETVDRSGTLHWSLVGGDDKLDHPQLRLMISGQLNLVCQRCLTAMPFTIASESVLIVAKNEDAADAIEQLSDDEEIDVIVGDVAFDVTHLVEDEALLALPLAPKHDVCPGKAAQPSVAAEKLSPFSVLKNLKQ